MKKRIIAFALAIAMALVLTACNDSGSEPSSQSGAGLGGTVDKPYIITFGYTGNVTNPEHPYRLAMAAMNEKLMELSGGTLGFEIVFGGVYGSTAQHLAQIKAGTLDGMGTGFDTATNLENSERFFAIATPYVFDSDEHIDKFLASDLWAEMVNDLAKDNGIRITTLFFHQPPRSLNTNRPIEHPSDVAGLKLRVPESDVQVRVWQAAGASPVQIPASELYSALDTGLADGQENDLPTGGSQKIYEVAPYFTQIDYIRQAQLLYTSEITWNKMSDQEKEWFLEAARYAGKVAEARYVTLYDEAITAITNNGGTIVECDYNEWKDFFTKIVKEQFDGVRFPKGLYDQIQAMA